MFKRFEALILLFLQGMHAMLNGEFNFSVRREKNPKPICTKHWVSVHIFSIKKDYPKKWFKAKGKVSSISETQHMIKKNPHNSFRSGQKKKKNNEVKSLKKNFLSFGLPLFFLFWSKYYASC